MKILLIGSGGREHALAWKISQSALCDKLYAAPGSDGMKNIAEKVDIKADDPEGLLKFAKKEAIGLTVVGPEVPLVGGIVDLFEKESLKIFGPTKDMARLEGSKVFAKEFMKRVGIPTADFKIFDKYEDALEYASSRSLPVVIKADGVAAGKGVIICKKEEDIAPALKSIMVERVFGKSGDRVIVEDCLSGEEVSILVVSDGKNFVPLVSSQDHKKVFDSDLGPNTGGMGAYSPAFIINEEVFHVILDTIVKPVISSLSSEGRGFKGVLYAGIMMTDKGPYVLEFNTRFGDPETQVIMPRLKSDIVDLMLRSVEGRLEGYHLEWDDRPCVSVVLASGGYPGEYEKGMEIQRLDEAAALQDVIIFHAGTKLGRRSSDKENLFITDGGRVLNVTAMGSNFKDAVERCYDAVRVIWFDKIHYRTDIGYKAVKHASKK